MTKEVHYFTKHHYLGGSWYKSNFPYSFSRRFCGEATPFYLYHPLAAERIYKFNPEIKLIAVLRNPIYRAVSHYFHAFRHGFETRSIEDAFVNEVDESLEFEKRIDGLVGIEAHRYQELSYISRGFYAKQLDRYDEIFGRDRLLILRSEDFFSDPVNSLKKVFSFIGLERSFVPDSLEAKNVGKYSLKNTEHNIAKVIEHLEEIYKEPNLALKSKYGICFD